MIWFDINIYITYMPSHPHLAGDTRIFLLSPALKIFTRFHFHFA